MSAIAAFPRRAESWLDERGKFAWIAAMVLSFILFWPLGLALLAYMIWGKKMFGNNCRNRTHSHRQQAWAMNNSSGNAAFDTYKADMLKRLEDEQSAFAEFLKRLRDAKDKAEFDQFMDDRARRSADDRRQVDTPL